MSYVRFEQCSYDIVPEPKTAPGPTPPPTPSPTPAPDDRWWPDEAECKQFGAPDWLNNKYDSQATCCTNHFSWDYNACMGITTTMPPPSGKWYISWAIGKCVKDCPKGSGESCGGLVPGSWISTHGSANACCGAHMSYAPISECKHT